jgi:hypothetical protein
MLTVFLVELTVVQLYSSYLTVANSCNTIVSVQHVHQHTHHTTLNTTL